MGAVKYISLSWDDIEQSVASIYSQIASGGRRFECIMAVLRGGSIPARLLADRLDTRIRMLAIGVTSYYGIGLRKPAPQIDIPLQADIQGMNVLVADDIADSGHTMRVVTEHLKEKGALTVSTATLYWKPDAGERPDYCAATVQQDEWIVFPWERFEFERQLSGTVHSPDTTNSAANSTLPKQDSK